MRAEGCRQWREALGAYTLGQLSEDERRSLEAHLEGCAACRAEAESLATVARLLPHADPARFGPAPLPPVELGQRIAAQVNSERRSRRRRRGLRLGLGLGFAAASAAAATAVLAIFVLGGGEEAGPEQRVTFRSLPSDVKIAATLAPRAYGTEIHMYVKGISSGTLCRVSMRGPNGVSLPAGSFRYRWGGDAAVLSAALDLSRARALVVRAGERTFVAPLGTRDTAPTSNRSQKEEPT